MFAIFLFWELLGGESGCVSLVIYISVLDVYNEVQEFIIKKYNHRIQI
jgi:hypothetical protein